MKINFKTILKRGLSIALATLILPNILSCAVSDMNRYSQAKEEYLSDGISAVDNVSVSVLGNEYSAFEGEKPASGDKKSSILWNENTRAISWDIDVPYEGIYNIKVSFLAGKGSTLSPSRKLLINGEQPFKEAAKIIFDRLWVDETIPAQNALGDDICPMQAEVSVWREKAIYDSQGSSIYPLEFKFSSGKNTITMEYIGEPLNIEKITVCSIESIADYSEVSAEYKSKKAEKGVYIEAEAKDSIEYKTEASILSQSNSDPSASPFEATKIRLNTVGAYSWLNGHQEICWKIDAPEDGLYKIHFRALQNWNSGLSSYRSLRINGKIPFKQAELITFKYSTKWQDLVLENEKGEPYLLELKKGENLISLSVEFGPVAEIADTLSDAAAILSDLVFDITRITGYSPDPNYNYALETEIPDLIDELNEVRGIVSKAKNDIAKISAKNSTMEGNFKSALSDIDILIERPTLISNRLEDLNTMLTNLSDWASTLRTGPLALDYIELLPPDEKVESKQASILKKISVTLKNFVASFTKDYNAIGGGEYEEPLDVWVSRGKEWAQIIEERSADYTEKTGRRVKFHILPSGSISSSVNPLLLTLSSGIVPDAVMGLPYDLPVEYALRNMVYDLTQFEDFGEISERFLDQSLVPFTYDKHIYALPESISFRVMYYRTDILERLGLKVPNTWDEVYNEILPVLNQNNMKMYVPQILDMFLYQNGGEYYSADGKTSALGSGEAYLAFRELCELYTDNGVPVAANFYNRFRTGEIPIGIENASQYMLFSYAAPEIAGNWEIAPVPAHISADGTLNRSNSGTAVDGCIILQNAKHKNEAWDFLKWWTDTDTQLIFSRQVEGRIGAKARWLSANIEAFNQLPWTKNDRVAINSAFEWVKETPVVLGSYFANRHLVNAINRTVIQGMSPRDSIEEAVEQINNELSRRQSSYYRRLNKSKKEAS